MQVEPRRPSGVPAMGLAATAAVEARRDGPFEARTGLDDDGLADRHGTPGAHTHVASGTAASPRTLEWTTWRGERDVVVQRAVEPGHGRRGRSGTAAGGAEGVDRDAAVTSSATNSTTATSTRTSRRVRSAPGRRPRAPSCPHFRVPRASRRCRTAHSRGPGGTLIDQVARCRRACSSIVVSTSVRLRVVVVSTWAVGAGQDGRGCPRPDPVTRRPGVSVVEGSGLRARDGRLSRSPRNIAVCSPMALWPLYLQLAGSAPTTGAADKPACPRAVLLVRAALACSASASPIPAAADVPRVRPVDIR